MIKRVILLILLLGLSLFSCTENEKKEGESKENIILLNDELVIDENLNISYQVPLNWDKMPASLSKKYVARLNSKNKNEFVLYFPKSFFYDKNSSALLRVGKVTLKEGSSTSKLTPQKYVELFERFNTNLKINQEQIVSDNLEMIKLIIEKGKLLSFKIIFYNWQKEIIQLDFSIKKEDASKLKSAIDAAIKSIKLL